MLSSLIVASALMLSACGDDFKSINSNKMIEGSRKYYYAYVNSSQLGKVAYNITGWAEYDPEGGSFNACYNGLELQLNGGEDVVYFYEQNLVYTLTRQQREEFKNAGFEAVNFSWNV